MPTGGATWGDAAGKGISGPAAGTDAGAPTGSGQPPVRFRTLLQVAPLQGPRDLDEDRADQRFVMQFVARGLGKQARG